MLKKIKAIIGLAILAGLAGFVAKIQGADYIEAFGPSAGAFASAGVGFAVKESYDKITAYLAKTFGVEVPAPQQDA